MSDKAFEFAVFVKRDGRWVMDEHSYWGSESVAIVRACRTEGETKIIRRPRKKNTP